ncbi:MAG TPA: TlpA disulfide reductase family protein [Polyangiaceae bacterium]|nr:TlpA disulfide reductase family protein [Polyangiaceae bacterium]
MTDLFSRASAACFVGALAAILSAGCEDAKSASDVGVTAHDFTATDVNSGGTFRLRDHIGKEVVLIDFWATWCQPCLAEMPHLEALWEKYRSRGFLVVAVSMDSADQLADVPAFAKRNQMNFPVLTDEDSSIAGLYNPRKSAPLSVIIDKQGHISAVREGYSPGDEAFVEKDVLKALSAGEAPAASASAAPASSSAPSAAPASSSAPSAAPVSSAPASK